MWQLSRAATDAEMKKKGGHMDFYPCSLSESKTCEHGGNKRYNYGFMRGTSEYCRLKRKWVHNLKECPRKEPANCECGAESKDEL